MTQANERVAMLRKLCAAATPGPWLLGSWWGQLADGQRIFGTDTMDGPPDQGPANAALIVALRNEVPGLLDEMERMREALDWFVANASKIECFVQDGNLLRQGAQRTGACLSEAAMDEYRTFYGELIIATDAARRALGQEG